MQTITVVFRKMTMIQITSNPYISISYSQVKYKKHRRVPKNGLTTSPTHTNSNSNSSNPAPNPASRYTSPAPRLTSPASSEVDWPPASNGQILKAALTSGRPAPLQPPQQQQQSLVRMVLNYLM